MVAEGFYSRMRSTGETFEMDSPPAGYSIHAEVKRSLHAPDYTEITVSWYGANPREYEFTADRQEPGSVMWDLKWDWGAEQGSTTIEAREFHEFAQYAYNVSWRIRNERK